MTFLSVRITPEHCKDVDFSWDFGKCSSENEQCFWDVFTSSFLDDECRYLVAHEATNKFGEPCSQHYHINIHGKISVKKETMQKWFNKFGAKGNKAYCIQICEDVEDEGRWWRYCCKESLLLHRGFSVEDLSKMVEMAVSERRHQVATNVKTRDRLVNKNQFRDKLFKYLKEKYPNETNRVKLIQLIGEYYQEQGKTPPFSKLGDVCLDFLISMKHMSWQEYVGWRYAHLAASAP